jgi:hypothetical protein
MAIAALHHVHHVFTHQIPESIPAHVLGEWAAFAIGGAAVFAGASAVCNWFSQTK